MEEPGVPKDEAAGVDENDDGREYDEIWHRVLTEGHGKLSIARRFFAHVPHEPRCKLCRAPFAGVGRMFGFVGFRPSRKNPNLCVACVEAMPPGGAEVDVAILFADVRGSTTLGEQLDPRTFAGRMNRFYRVTSDILIEYDALIDKLIGDEVMALWVPGFAGPNYHAKALAAGQALLRAMRAADGQEAQLQVGVAVHSGTAFVGNVGREGVMDYTALGDTVNTAARLQSFAAHGELVVSEQLWQAAKVEDSGEVREVNVRGKAESMRVHVLRV